MGDSALDLRQAAVADGLFSTASRGSPAGAAHLNAGLNLTYVGLGWITASLAVFMPIIVDSAITIGALAWVNGATLSGNVDAGVYDRNGNRIVSVGGTPQSGTSVAQVGAIAATTLLPDLYYAALVLDNNVGMVAKTSSNTTALCRVSGMVQMAAAYPLPTAATFAAYAVNQGPFLLSAPTNGSVI